MEIYSIGFTQKSAGEFFGTLKANGIERRRSEELEMPNCNSAPLFLQILKHQPPMAVLRSRFAA